MKICLVSFHGLENTGVRILYSSLKARGFLSSIVFLKRWVNNQMNPLSAREEALFYEYIKMSGTKVVGFSLLPPFFKLASELTRKIQKNVGLKVIWGGIYPTVLPERAIRVADAVCVGEGEQSLTQWLEMLENGGEQNGEIPGIWYKAESGDIISGEPFLIQDLNKLPFPDYSDDDRILIDDDRIYEGEPLRNSAQYRIYPTRGCPFSCSYCYNSMMKEIFRDKGKYYRIRSVDSVIQELEMAAQSFPRLQRIIFDGDTFTFPSSWLDKFIEEYPKKVGRRFEILLSPSATLIKKLGGLKAAGLCKVQMGIEAGSKKELGELYERQQKQEKIIEFAKIAADLGIQVTYDIIVDDPLAGDEDKKTLLDLLFRLPRKFNLFLYSLTIFPGTALEKKLLGAGAIKPEQVEGESCKSFSQFRVSFDYPRPDQEKFWIAILALVTKRFIPVRLILWLWESRFLRKHPAPVLFFAQFSNFLKVAWIAGDLLLKGELTSIKVRQYGSLRKLIIQ